MRKTMMLTIATLAFAPVMVLAQDVSVDYDKTYDFSKIKTVAAKLASQPDDPLQGKRVVDGVTQALTSKGWAQADESAADAIVMIHGSSQTRKKLTAYGGGGWRMGGGMGSAQLDDYKVGSLVVDIFDAKSKSLLYRGTASGELSDKADKNAQKIEKAIDKMFKDFPPGSKK
ncbi:MAG TPA: DUF4136 domain-containing protein [Candidatus Methylomirabilis sp.]|nr:DUF4136 domain-containing protein [Candidatus Methylomirabilis sp.]